MLASWFTSLVLWQLQMLKDQMTCLCWLRWADATIKASVLYWVSFGGPGHLRNKHTYMHSYGGHERPLLGEVWAYLYEVK